MTFKDFNRLTGLPKRVWYVFEAMSLEDQMRVVQLYKTEEFENEEQNTALQLLLVIRDNPWLLNP